MDAFLGGCFLFVVLVLALFGAMFIAGGSLDSAILKSCKEHGYRNFGQNRVICSVEVRK